MKKMKSKSYFFIFVCFFFWVIGEATYFSERGLCWANSYQGKETIHTAASSNERLEFFYYIPQQNQRNEKLPILVCVPGLNGSGAPYVKGEWAKFADENGFVIISPCFRFDQKDWKQKKSYQFPNVWSGDALLRMFDQIEKRVNISKNEVYLFGHSAGAQVAHRFALWKPYICKAVAFHAPGGVTCPKTWIPVNFFVTVGDNDSNRTKKAKQFTQRCKDLGISIVYQEYPGIGHRLTANQVQGSLDFFRKIMDLET